MSDCALSPRKLSALFIATILLSGCQSAASHMPPLWALPGAAMGTAIGNAAYSVRRERVADAVRQYYPPLRQEVYLSSREQQPHLQRIAAIAGVPSRRYNQLAQVLRDDPDSYFMTTTNSPTLTQIEPLVIAIMVHGD